MDDLSEEAKAILMHFLPAKRVFREGKYPPRCFVVDGRVHGALGELVNADLVERTVYPNGTIDWAATGAALDRKYAMIRDDARPSCRFYVSPHCEAKILD